MESASTEILLFWFLIMILVSAFFSSSETGMMRVNRYRLKSTANSKSKDKRAAARVSALLKRPDRLLGLILIGNNFVNFYAASLATLIAVRLWGNIGYDLAPFLLTGIVLIFAELTPKTVASVYPEKIAYPSSWLLSLLLKIFLPLVQLINAISNGLLRLVGIKSDNNDEERLDADELRAIVTEASPMIPKRHQKMLLNILNLEASTVEDIMVPRMEIVGIDLQDPWDDIVDQLRNSQHTRLLVYDGEVDNPQGILHARSLINITTHQDLTIELLKSVMSPVYYIPEGTPLHTQLLKFQRKKERIGAVVDEYGDIQGLVTLEDILEEIVGEFTTDLSSEQTEIKQQQDGSLLVDCTITLRDLNKELEYQLPTDGPKTLNGLITEHLEFLPEQNYRFELNGYPMLVVEVDENRLEWVQIFVEQYQPHTDDLVE